MARMFRGGYLRNCKKIMAAYSLAVAVYLVVQTQGFDFSLYLYYLFHFNISGPHYFVLLYVQLMVWNGVLYCLLQKCPVSVKGWVCEGMVLAGILVLASWTTNHTNILDVYGGGGKLFGGTYLVLYYFGMLVQRHGWLREGSIEKSVGMLAFFGTAWFLCWRYTCKNGYVLDRYVPFGPGSNPPSATLSISAVFMLFAMFGLFTILGQSRYLSWVSLLADKAGRHTLYIFLYHRLILDCFLLEYMLDLPQKNRWIARVVYFGVMITGAWLIEWVVSYVQKNLEMKRV